jgi:hypothetical protein
MKIIRKLLLAIFSGLISGGIFLAVAFYWFAMEEDEALDRLRTYEGIDIVHVDNREDGLEFHYQNKSESEIRHAQFTISGYEGGKLVEQSKIAMFGDRLLPGEKKEELVRDFDANGDPRISPFFQKEISIQFTSAFRYPDANKSE